MALADGEGQPLAVLGIQDVFTYDREVEAGEVFRTSDPAHPGVAYLTTRGDWLIEGRVEAFRRPNARTFPCYRLDPTDTRRIFAEREWKTVAGFQTRNPVHRAQEYMQKTALEIVDGLLPHLVAGETKSAHVSLAPQTQC